MCFLHLWDSDLSLHCFPWSLSLVMLYHYGTLSPLSHSTDCSDLLPTVDSFHTTQPLFIRTPSAKSVVMFLLCNALYSFQRSFSVYKPRW